jgi:hypothetical protein
MITPGTAITTIGTDGVERTGVVQSVHYSGPEPEIVARPHGWRAAIRRMTPQRWRRPLPVVRPYKPATVSLGFDDDPSAVARCQKQLTAIFKSIETLTRQP